MTIRKHNDSVKSGKGIDGDLGEDFVKPGPDQYYGYPGNINVPEDRDIKGRKVRNSPGYAAYSPDSDGRLTRTNAIESWETRDIFDDTMKNDRPGGDDNTDFDTTGPIRAGVNKPQRR